MSSKGVVCRNMGRKGIVGHWVQGGGVVSWALINKTRARNYSLPRKAIVQLSFPADNFAAGA